MIELRNVTRLKLKAFLDSEYGVEVLLFLRENEPKIKRGQEHEIVFDGGRVDGYVECVERLVKMTSAGPKGEIDLENR